LFTFFNTRQLNMPRTVLAEINTNKRRGCQLSDGTKQRIIGRHCAGQKAAQIAREESLPASTVRTIISRWKQRGTTDNKLRSGRPKVTTRRERRYLVRTVRDHPQMPFESIKEHLGVYHSTSTIKRVFHEEDLLHWRSKRRLELTEQHAAHRLTWALQH
jgi:transposase